MKPKSAIEDFENKKERIALKILDLFFNNIRSKSAIEEDFYNIKNIFNINFKQNENCVEKDVIIIKKA